MRIINNLKNKFNKFFDILIEFIFPRCLPLIFIIFLVIAYSLQEYIGKWYIKVQEFQIFVNESILTTSLLGSLVEIPILLLGIYITVISVFGIGFSKATVLVAKNNQAKNFIKYAQVAIVSAVLFLMSTILYDLISFELWALVYLNILIWCFANFIRFITITMKMYTINIQDADEQAMNSENSATELCRTINRLLDDKTNPDIDSDEYYNNIVKKNENKIKESEKIKE